jgi:hypothetical protein
MQKQKLSQSELTILAALPVVLINVLGKPSRSKNLVVRTMDELEEMMQVAKEGNYIQPVRNRNEHNK